MLERVLVAVDGSPSADAALAFAIRVGRGYRSELIVCTAIDRAAAIAAAGAPDGAFASAELVLEEYEHAATSLLADAASRAAAAGVRASTALLDGRPAPAVIACAKERDARAIVIGTRGQRGLEHLVLGSAAEGVLRMSDVPVFVVGCPAPQARAPEASSFGRILVAVDESDASSAARTLALELAATAKSRLTFCHVVETDDLLGKTEAFWIRPETSLRGKAPARRNVDRGLCAGGTRTRRRCGRRRGRGNAGERSVGGRGRERRRPHRRRNARTPRAPPSLSRQRGGRSHTSKQRTGARRARGRLSARAREHATTIASDRRHIVCGAAQRDARSCARRSVQPRRSKASRRRADKIFVRETPFERVMAITRDILRVRDLEPALESIAHAVQDLYAFRYVTIVAAEGSGGDMVRRVMLGWPADVVAARRYERIVRADIIDVLKKQFEVVENVFFVPAEREFPWARSIYTGEASRDAPREAPDRWHERDSLAFVLPDYHGEMLAYISVDGPVDGKVPSLETLTSMQLFVNLTGLAVANAQAHVAEIERRELLEASQARLRHEATHDSLTGLPNRAAFSELLAAKLELARAAPDAIYAVLFVDLDEFKSINDSLGHVAGDHMLNAVAERMRETIGPSDFVARLGGDEFAVLVDARGSLAEIERVAVAIHGALLTPITIDSQLVYNTASIGIATIGPRDESIEDVLRHADTAMYHAKSLGRAGHAFFDEDMHEQATRRLALMNDLRTAIEREQFYVAYQPIVALEDGRVTGFEALVRWNHPTSGEVLPGEFVPLAEDIGLIVDIGRFVFAQACEKLAAWRLRAPDLDLNMHVNFSVQEALKHDCDAFVFKSIARCGLAPSDITLELTETAIMRSGNAAQAAFERLHATGVRLCVDDFGTGYSSLRYLHQFPVDSLKIDRSFVESADGELGSVSIVRIVIQLAEHFGIAVVAEGIETEAQAQALRKLGCAYAQGFHFHKPLDVEAVETLLDSITGVAAASLPPNPTPARAHNGAADRERARVELITALPPPVSRRGRRIRDLPIVVAKPA